ncbi:MAG: RHS repeat-associated core domain-containing protein [Verrucomicrobiota bacterium]
MAHGKHPGMAAPEARTNIALADGNNTFTAIAQDSYGRLATNSVTTYLPATLTCSYDLNGNLRTNGNRVLEYDDENQLTAVTVSNAWRSEFTYDGKMRRRLRKEFTWQSSTWLKTNEVRYVYDGNLVLQERDGNNLPAVTYTRGKDLSGSLEGAGGIGGLLGRTDMPATLNGQPASAYYHADGNGNVTCLVATNQLVVARYLYDPFGNTLSASGPLAEVNLYRFSSKEQHPNSGLVYYLYRFYDASLQRWPNRDPLQEKGGVNLYGFVRNNPLNLIDSDGRAPMGWPVLPPPGRPPSLPPKPPQKPKNDKCCTEDNPAKDLFKTAADTLAGEVGGKAGGIVRILLLAADAEKGCGDMKGAADTCLDFARRQAADPGYPGAVTDCQFCCQAIMGSFPGLGGIDYYFCLNRCRKL